MHTQTHAHATYASTTAPQIARAQESAQAQSKSHARAYQSAHTQSKKLHYTPGTNCAHGEHSQYAQNKGAHTLYKADTKGAPVERKRREHGHRAQHANHIRTERKPRAQSKTHTSRTQCNKKKSREDKTMVHTRQEAQHTYMKSDIRTAHTAAKQNAQT